MLAVCNVLFLARVSHCCPVNSSHLGRMSITWAQQAKLCHVTTSQRSNARSFNACLVMLISLCTLVPFSSPVMHLGSLCEAPGDATLWRPASPSNIYTQKRFYGNKIFDTRLFLFKPACVFVCVCVWFNFYIIFLLARSSLTDLLLHISSFTR